MPVPRQRAISPSLWKSRLPLCPARSLLHTVRHTVRCSRTLLQTCKLSRPLNQGPQPPDCGPGPACILLGTRQLCRRWAVGEWVMLLHLPLPIAPWPPEPPPCPQPGKNGLPRNQSLVPKRLGTAALNHWSFCLWLLALWPWSWASTGLVDLWGAAQHRSQRVGHDQVTSLTFSVLLLLIFIVISAVAFRSSASLKQCSCDAPPPFSLVLIYWLGVLGFRSLFYTLHFLSVHFMAHPYV